MANNIPDDNADMRKAIFLSEVGRDIHQVLSDICSPDKAVSKTLDQLLKKWKEQMEFLNHLHSEHGYRKITKASPAIKKLTLHENFPDINRWLHDRFVKGLHRNHAAFQEKLGDMTNLTFERAVKIAANMTMVKDHARQFHSPDSATIRASSIENVNRVRFAPKQSEGR